MQGVPAGPSPSPALSHLEDRALALPLRPAALPASLQSLPFIYPGTESVPVPGSRQQSAVPARSPLSSDGCRVLSVSSVSVSLGEQKQLLMVQQVDAHVCVFPVLPGRRRKRASRWPCSGLPLSCWPQGHREEKGCRRISVSRGLWNGPQGLHK